MCRIGASGCASGEALKRLGDGSVLKHMTSAKPFRNEASGATSRAFKEDAAYEYQHGISQDHADRRHEKPDGGHLLLREYARSVGDRVGRRAYRQGHRKRRGKRDSHKKGCNPAPRREAVSPSPAATAAKTGTSSAAVAVLLMKVDIT